MKIKHRKNDEPKEVAAIREDPFESFWNRWLSAPFTFESRLPELFRRYPFPVMNVSEDEQGYQVSLDLPGLDEEDFDIEILGNQLVVSGERKWKEEKKEREYHRVESQYGSFQRSFTLPDDARLEPDRIDATYKKGILAIAVPKVEPTPVRKIKVKAEK